ncbi:MAG: dTDP-4-dehydrorhamnose 3,5-epimerase [Alphaproteobacteria bacterium]
MRFHALPLDGAWIIEAEPLADARGTFTRLWCAETFAARGLVASFVQANLSTNARAGTLRGLHWQEPPHAEAKLVRCLSGRIHAVIVDLRPGSATRRRWHAVELSAGDGRQLYVPEGFAHGFQTLTDGVEVSYLVSAAHAPAASRGARWDDPALAIVWPLPVSTISDRDRAWPDLAR